jgi:hypothetical protein
MKDENQNLLDNDIELQNNERPLEQPPKENASKLYFLFF